MQAALIVVFVAAFGMIGWPILRIATSIHYRGLDGSLAVTAARIMALSRAWHAGTREYRAVRDRYERGALRDVRRLPAKPKPAAPAKPPVRYHALIERIFLPQKEAA